jgi:hypothetical protein
MGAPGTDLRQEVMDRMRLSLVGGARLSRGDFEAYLSQGNQRYYLDSGPVRDFIEEYFMFLRTEEPNREIAGKFVERGFTARGLPKVSFDVVGITFSLFRKDVNYCVLVMEPPASLREMGQEVDYSPVALPDEGEGGQDWSE